MYTAATLTASVLRTLGRVLVSPQAIALCSLVVLSATLVGVSRFTLPRRLASPEPLRSNRDGYTEQLAGYVRIPASGSYSLSVSAPGRALLFVDGAPAGTFMPENPSARTSPIAAGVHRVHVQFVRTSPTDRPAELLWSDGRLPQAVPPEALSPRSMAPIAWRGRDFLKPLTIGMVWLWFATGVWLVARPFLSWYRRQLSDGEVAPVTAILSLSLLLAGHGMSWGLPGGWAQDEIGSTDITGALSQWFVGGWYHRYPPLHFYLLGLVHLPLIVADRLDMTDFWSLTGLGEVARISRALTVVMSVGTAAFVYLVARTALASVRSALLASLCWVLVLTVAYFGKLTNVDMPYTFWFAVSLLGYVRAQTRNAVRDYLLFAAAAAAAVCTKDMAYGLFVFPIVHLIVHRVRTVLRDAQGPPVLAVLRDRALPAAAATGILGFAAIQALPFNWSGVRQHYLFISAGGGYQMIDVGSASGQAALFGRSFEHLAWSMSWPGLLIALAGIAYQLWRRRFLVAAVLLLPAVSYYMTLIAVVGYSYDRFMIPVCLVLSVFAGAALDAAWPAGAPRWRTAAVATVLTYMALRTTSINVLMAADGRYVVERWIRENVPLDVRIGAVEHVVVLPRFFEYGKVPLRSLQHDLPAARPAIVVITDNYLTRLPPDSPERESYVRLLGGAAGYDVAMQYQTKMPFAILAFEPRFRHPDGSFTTLHKVNPLVTVLRRRDVP